MHTGDARSDHAPRAGPRNYTLERRWMPDADGVLTRISYTSVPLHVGGGAHASFDWGSGAAGAYELALNLLEDVLQGARHTGPRSSTVVGTCFTAALRLAADYAEEVLSSMPDDGGVITSCSVKAWIAGHTARLDPAEHACLAPRYACEGDRVLGSWTHLELEAIMGEDLVPQSGTLCTRSGERIATLIVPHPLDGAVVADPV